MVSQAVIIRTTDTWRINGQKDSHEEWGARTLLRISHFNQHTFPCANLRSLNPPSSREYQTRYEVETRHYKLSLPGTYLSLTSQRQWRRDKHLEDAVVSHQRADESNQGLNHAKAKATANSLGRVKMGQRRSHKRHSHSIHSTYPIRSVY